MPSKKAADVVDTQLARYREMRDFGVTAEPSGKTKATKLKELPFVIQKHAASHLHYDFRLGWNGVLKSWAVAKGPSYLVKDRRLAVQVEDHPMEYGGFEGIIPKGQYGGGTVMVWDQGTWSPQPGHEDIDDGLKAGSLKFELHGKKLKGKWTLVRMNQKPGSKWGNSSKPNWLLIKEHDDQERSLDDPCITEEKPNSAVTGRTMELIAKQEDHIWNSKDTAGTGQAWFRNVAGEAPVKAAKKPAGRKAATPKAVRKRSTKSRAKEEDLGTALASLPRESQPAFVAPQLALEATTPPATDNYLHELKLDGYRMQARKHGAKVQLLTRKGLDWTHRMPTIAAALRLLPAEEATLDGEVVVLDQNGTTSFAKLQASFNDKASHELTYFAFDLLHLNGHNLRGLPLRERKAMLAQLLPDHDGDVRLSEHIEGDGEALFRKACELHAEGIISKRADAPYRSGRSADWLKSKCLREQEFVVVGFTPSTEGPGMIGSLLLGYYEGKQMIYAGRTGTGFTQKLKRDLHKQLSKIERDSSPFTTLPSDARRGVHWVKPQLVAQVRFATWTADGLVRQAAFLGLREDKTAAEVTREEPTVAPKPKSSGSKLPSRDASSKPAKSTKQQAPPSLRLTHPGKIIDPESGLTKQQLADYYWAIADRMLPHIADRPLSLVRCPDGAGKPCFFQKHVNKTLPPGIGTVMVPDKKTGVPEAYITLNSAEALAGLAQMGVLEIHPWGSTNADLEHPDRLIFDLDPDEAISWNDLCSAADDTRKRLSKLGLKSFLKTTGGKGLHVVAPIMPEHAWPEVKEAAHQLVVGMERDEPTRYLTKMTKSARKGKIYLDYLRNDRGATAVAPYSPRARLGMHVSLPLPWSALKLPDRPVFAVVDFARWQSKIRTDPWKSLGGIQQSLESPGI